MLTAIILTESTLRDAIVGLSSGIKKTHDHENVAFYQKNSNIFAFSAELPIEKLYTLTIEEFQPEKIFIVQSGRSVDVDHEVGDVILPNIFFSFDEKILNTEITSENRDSLIGKAEFLEIFDEQKDYYVENYGLSVGGIAVENVPETADAEALMSVYEADVYLTKPLKNIANIIRENTLPTLLLVGITEGKLPRNSGTNHILYTAENIITTMRLIGEEESL